ncbi:putative lambda Rz1-like spanin [Burkholderia phage AMP1]|uniref:Putative lambda Rz1-like spanin n=1 Tax=Burkholderia phage AMP1 TaxID=2601683 RepID=A0A5C2IG58_9CAUD|nr:putative lambda Rz1-like spanin [Burkholderia phage AMP1]
MQHLKRTVLGLTLLCLTLCGTACSLAPKVQTQTIVQKELPPESLLADCAYAPEPSERTNAALAVYVYSARTALDVCNADKAALRAWASQASQPARPH